MKTYSIPCVQMVYFGHYLNKLTLSTIIGKKPEIINAGLDDFSVLCLVIAI